MKTFAKRSLAIFIAVLMIFSVMTVCMTSVSAEETTPTTDVTENDSTTEEPAPVDPSTRSVSFAGSFNDWNLTDNPFEYVEGNTFHHAIVLAPGTYTFKVVVDTLWFGANTIIEGSTEIQMEATAGDCAIESTGGQFDLYFDVETNKLSVNFTQMEFEENTELPTVALSGSFNDWATTDYMEAPGNASFYYPACDASISGLNAALTSIGVDNSKEHRMEIALANGIEDYTYTPEQNTAMLKLLKEGKLLNPEVVSYYPACDASYVNLNPALTSIGVDSSKAHRMEIAIANGMTDYAYTAEQNTELLNLLKAGKLLNPDVLGPSGDTVFTTTLNLGKGEYYFSVVKNSLWYGNSSTTIYDTANSEKIRVNGGACTLVASGGEYTFEYDYKANTLTITAITEYKPTDLTVVSLSGDFNNWSKNDMFEITSATTVEKTYTLKKGSYHFKVVQDGLWYGNNGTIENTTTSTSSVGWKMEMTAGDCILQANGGTYKFIYTVTTKMLTVEFTPSDESPAEMANVTLSGDFNSWSWDDVHFTVASDTTVEATLSLTAGTYDFKVVEDGLWYGNDVTIENTSKGVTLSYTGTNCHLVATGGEYTFTYDVMSKLLVVTAELTEFRPVDLSEVYLAGDFNGWDPEKDLMTEVSDNEVSKTVSLKSGAYYFKVVKDGLWYGNPSRIANTTENLALSYTAGDCILVTSGGDYTFTFNVTSNKLKITYVPSTEDPAETANVTIAGDFNSWSTTKTKFTHYAQNQVAVTVSLKEGYHGFKIVYNGLWYGWDEDVIYDVTDFNLPLSTSSGECAIDCYGGDYTFIFDVITLELKITAKLDGIDPAYTSVVSVAGDFNNWSTDNIMSANDEENIVVYYMDITPGIYYFKIVQDGLWYGNGSEINNETTSGQKLTTTGSECILNAKGGMYTFIYNVVTRTLSITCDESEFDYTAHTKAYIAGEFNNWVPDLSPMTSVSNEVVYIDIPLEAGEYKFKVVMKDNEYGHSGWFGNSGTVITDEVEGLLTSNTATEITLKATEAGTYTFYYDVVDYTLSIVYDCDDWAEYGYVALVASFNNWDNEATPLTYEGNGIFSTTVKLTKGTYEFKMNRDDAYYGNEGIINNTTQVTSDVGWAMTTNAGNCTLMASGGSYTFNYNYYTNFLEVVYNG